MLDTQSPFLPTPPQDAVALTARKLLSAIILGGIAPGARLSEIEIGKGFGQGRGIVRAALGKLAHGGFVVSQPRSGWRVSPISAAGLREIILARRRLEGLLADAPLSAEDLTHIQTIADMQSALRAAPPGLSAEHDALQRGYDRQIREMLCDKLRAPLITGWLGNLWDKSERYIAYFEKSVGRSAPQFDWAPFIEAKRRMRHDDAVQLLSEGCEVFARFAQASLLDSDLVAPDAAKKQPKAVLRKAVPSQEPSRPDEHPLKRTM